nr:hypothetical protein [Vibrio navarrensis]
MVVTALCGNLCIACLHPQGKIMNISCTTQG